MIKMLKNFILTGAKILNAWTQKQLIVFYLKKSSNETLTNQRELEIITHTKRIKN